MAVPRAHWIRLVGLAAAIAAAASGAAFAAVADKPAPLVLPPPFIPAPTDINPPPPPPQTTGPTAAAPDAPPQHPTAGALPKAKSDDKAIAEFGRLIEDAVATGDFVGLAVAVVRHGEIRLIRTYGVREIGGEDRVTTLTRFRIASLSKGMTGTLAGLAVAEGRVSLEEPVAPYAPTFRLRGGMQTRVTLEHVLSHRVGLPSHAYDNLLEQGLAPETILARYPQLPLVCAVGACYGYQNIAFDVAGDVLADVYKKPYADLLREKLFIPLGMPDASVGAEALVAGGDWARPHRRVKTGKGRYAFGPWRVGKVTPYYYAVPAAGGVNASILDLSLYLKAQMGYQPLVLPRAVLDLIHIPRTDTPAETIRMKKVSERFEETRYGLGWRIYQYAGQKVIAHGGTLDGYASQIAFLPDRDVGIVLLSNAQSRRFWRLLPSFLDIELGLPREDYLDLSPLNAARPAAPGEEEDDENDMDDGSSGAN